MSHLVTSCHSNSTRCIYKENLTKKIKENFNISRQTLRKPKFEIDASHYETSLSLHFDSIKSHHFTLHNLVNRISLEPQYWFYYISWYTELISLISSFTSLSIIICILKAYTSIFLVFIFTFNETRVDYHDDNNDLCRNFIHFMLQFNQYRGIFICLHVNMLKAYTRNVMWCVYKESAKRRDENQLSSQHFSFIIFFLHLCMLRMMNNVYNKK